MLDTYYNIVKNWFHTKKLNEEKGLIEKNPKSLIIKPQSSHQVRKILQTSFLSTTLLPYLGTHDLYGSYLKISLGSIVVKKHNIFHVNALVCYCCAETPIKLIHFPSFLIISLKFWMLYDAMELDFCKQEIERGREGG